MTSDQARPHGRLAVLAALVAFGILGGCASTPSANYDSAPQTAPRPDFDPPAMVRVADDLMRSGDTANALGLYRRASERDPKNARAWAGLGTAYLALGGVEEAAEAFARALAIDPGLGSARLGRAQALIRQGRPRAALVELESLLLSDPKNPKVFNAMGIALDLLGENAQAQIRYGQGLDLAPADVSLRSNLALSFAVSGTFETAIGLLRALAREPQADATVRQNLALVYGLAGQFDMAESLARMDLPEDAVRANLSYIAEIRGLNRRRLAAAVILGDPDLLQPEELLEARAMPSPAPEPSRTPAVETVDTAPVPPVPEATPAPSPPARAPEQPHRLTLADYQSRAQALIAWEALLRTNADLLEDLAPEVREVRDADDEGVRYVLGTEVVAPTPQARDLCRTLTARGIACTLGD